LYDKLFISELVIVTRYCHEQSINLSCKFVPVLNYAPHRHMHMGEVSFTARLLYASGKKPPSVPWKVRPQILSAYCGKEKFGYGAQTWDQYIAR